MENFIFTWANVAESWYANTQPRQENMCQTPITTGWHVIATNKYPANSPVRHSVWSLSDILSCLKRGKHVDFCQFSFLVPLGMPTDSACLTEEQPLGSLSFLQPPFSILSWVVPLGHATGHSHPRAALDLTCLSRFLPPTAIEIAIAEVKLTRNLLIPLRFGLARGDSHELAAWLSGTELHFRYESGLWS